MARKTNYERLIDIIKDFDDEIQNLYIRIDNLSYAKENALKELQEEI